MGIIISNFKNCSLVGQTQVFLIDNKDFDFPSFWQIHNLYLDFCGFKCVTKSCLKWHKRIYMDLFADAKFVTSNILLKVVWSDTCWYTCIYIVV